MPQASKTPRQQLTAGARLRGARPTTGRPRAFWCRFCARRKMKRRATRAEGPHPETLARWPRWVRTLFRGATLLRPLVLAFIKSGPGAEKGLRVFFRGQGGASPVALPLCCAFFVGCWFMDGGALLRFLRYQDSVHQSSKNQRWPNSKRNRIDIRSAAVEHLEVRQVLWHRNANA